MNAGVRHARDAEEFFTPELCWILEVANDPGDATASISRARVEVGVTTMWHRVAGTEERYIIFSGDGSVEVGDASPVRVTAGDVVRIPANVRQRIANVGQCDLILYCVCTPRFRRENYVALEA